ncbi:MAG: hypothetical protein M3Q56_10455 [Bacteroidota bacterium]|nr:hypothetical protein [Bacteroidota bacterium]
MKYLLVTIQFLLINLSMYSQVTEKSLGFQSSFIDAIREEEIGNYEQAVSILEKLVYEPETKANANFRLSKLYKQLNRHEDALNAIQESIKADPVNKWYQLFYIELLVSYSRYEQAASTYHNLILLEPENLAYYTKASEFYYKAFQLDQALENLSLAEKKFGFLSILALTKAEILKEQKKEKKAIETLERSFSAFPTRDELLPELIELHKSLKNEEAAKLYLGKLQKLNPSHSYLEYEKASHTSIEKTFTSPIEIAAANGLSLDEKIKRLFPFLEKFATSNDTTHKMAILQAADILIQQYPNDPKPFAFKGDILFHAENLNEAKMAYGQSVTKGTVPYLVWENLLISSMELDHWISLETFSNQTLDQYPNQTFPYYSLAESQFQQEKYEEALSNIDQLLLMTSKNQQRKYEALLMRAKIYRALKQDAKADEDFKLIVTDESFSLASLEFYIDQAKYGKAVPNENFEKAVKNYTGSAYIKQWKITEYYYYRKDYDRASTEIKKLLQVKATPSPSIYLLAGKIAELGAKMEDARIFYEKALLTAEYKNEIQSRLNKIKRSN